MAHQLLLDPGRLAALRQSNLLDTPAGEAFDRLVRQAARVLGVPITLVSLVLAPVTGQRPPGNTLDTVRCDLRGAAVDNRTDEDLLVAI